MRLAKGETARDAQANEASAREATPQRRMDDLVLLGLQRAVNLSQLQGSGRRPTETRKTPRTGVRRSPLSLP